MIRLTWKHDLYLFTISLLIGLFIWQGSRALNQTESSFLQGCSGELPSDIKRIFKEMNQEIEISKGILYARPDHIRFLDNNINVKEYRYAYGTLYCNDDPVVHRVKSFSFEYRDRLGQILTYVRKDISDIQMVGYTSRLVSKDRDVLLNSKVKVIPIMSYQ